MILLSVIDRKEGFNVKLASECIKRIVRVSSHNKCLIFIFNLLMASEASAASRGTRLPPTITYAFSV